MVFRSLSLRNTCQEIPQSTTRHHGTLVNDPLGAKCTSSQWKFRAGANFSAISGGDANALRWDKLGYGHMMKLAEEHGVEACISKTPSFEYWDEMPARSKIDSMAEYLQDVGLKLFCFNT